MFLQVYSNNLQKVNANSQKNIKKMNLNKIKYTISFSNPSNHYVQVSIKANVLNTNSLFFKMPVWTPGSYLVREYAQNIENTNVQDEKGNNLKYKKTNKNTWEVNCQECDEVIFTYDIYAFDLSVRTSFVDETQAYLNGASTFMYIEGREKEESTLNVNLPNEWTKISTSLQEIEKNIFTVPNFDILVDSPLQIGNHKEISYQQDGTLHRLAIYGTSDFDEDKFLEDVQKITKSATELIGENPCDEYLFIIHFTEKSSGGLEHLNSCTIQCNPEDFTTNYMRFLRLIAHEYFHLWNVKRIKPKTFENFDYNQENYTTLLWIAEGFTTYFELVILLKAGLMSQKIFWENIQERVELIENYQGKNVQSLADASFDAWIKAYRANENYRNSQISYYTKGSLIAMLLDVIILNNTQGEKRLIDVMKYLYEELYKKNQGYTENDITEVLSKIGKEDFSSFLNKYVYSTEEVDYKNYLKNIGLHFSFILANPNKPSLEVSFKNNQIQTVQKYGTAYEAGLNVGDKIITISGYEVRNIENFIAKQKVGDFINITFLRKGVLMSKEVKLLQDSWKNCSINPDTEASDEEKELYEKF